MNSMFDGEAKTRQNALTHLKENIWKEVFTHQDFMQDLFCLINNNIGIGKICLQFSFQWEEKCIIVD